MRGGWERRTATDGGQISHALHHTVASPALRRGVWPSCPPHVCVHLCVSSTCVRRAVNPPPSRTPTMLTCYSTTPPCPSCAQYNISNPSTGSQKTIDIDSDAAFRPFLEKRISHEVPGDSLGDDFKVRRQCVVCVVRVWSRASDRANLWPGLAWCSMCG